MRTISFLQLVKKMRINSIRLLPFILLTSFFYSFLLSSSEPIDFRAKSVKVSQLKINNTKGLKLLKGSRLELSTDQGYFKETFIDALKAIDEKLSVKTKGKAFSSSVNRVVFSSTLSASDSVQISVKSVLDKIQSKMSLSSNVLYFTSELSIGSMQIRINFFEEKGGKEKVEEVALVDINIDDYSLMIDTKGILYEDATVNQPIELGSIKYKGSSNVFFEKGDVLFVGIDQFEVSLCKEAAVECDIEKNDLRVVFNERIELSKLSIKLFGRFEGSKEASINPNFRIVKRDWEASFEENENPLIVGSIKSELILPAMSHSIDASSNCILSINFGDQYFAKNSQIIISLDETNSSLVSFSRDIKKQKILYKKTFQTC